MPGPTPSSVREAKYDASEEGSKRASDVRPHVPVEHLDERLDSELVSIRIAGLPRSIGAEEQRVPYRSGMGPMVSKTASSSLISAWAQARTVWVSEVKLVMGFRP
jgi:hypothetical protein